MNEKYIGNGIRKRVFLLGAGFTIPFGGPTTDKITGEFRKSTCYNVFNKPLGEYLLFASKNDLDHEPNFESILNQLEHLNQWAIKYHHHQLIVEILATDNKI